MEDNHSTLKSAVVIPLTQALVSAVLISVITYALASWLEAERPFIIALALFGIVALISWLSYRGEWRARLEALLGVDINRDGVIGEPLPVINELRVNVISDNGAAGDILALPGANREQLAALARGIVAGRGLSIHEWTGINRPFTRSQFEELRGQLLDRGFIRWRSNNAPQLGAEPTKKGEALFRALAEDARAPHSPTQARAWHESLK